MSVLGGCRPPNTLIIFLTPADPKEPRDSKRNGPHPWKYPGSANSDAFTPGTTAVSGLSG